MAKAVEISSLEFQWNVTDSWFLKVKDLSIASGEKVFLHGASGSGKTTLLDLLTGIHTQKKGSIKILGKELGELSAKQRDQFRADHLGFIFQQFNLLPYLNVIDNVLISCHFSKLRHQKASETGSIKKSAHDLLSSLGISSELHDKQASQLSVGQQQRVAIARSLIGNPEIIIADEPTSSLDSDARDAFIELLLKQVEQANSTIIFVSHDTELAKFFDKSISISELG
ncbi:MAG: ABC transporter ATP-binding protein [Gammaproteobacteria bacterium]|jgi:putative ABC transport system ATP-binding protein